MNQKSSLREVPQFVSGVLTGNKRNIQEDFARDEVSEHAKGLLFGNAFRLSPVNERAKFFTEKCVSAAKRVGAALIRTPDMFGPAKYLKENSLDTDYAEKCRKAIFIAAGDVVIFPIPPVTETLTDPKIEGPSGAALSPDVEPQE